MDIREDVEEPPHKSYQPRFLYNTALIILHFLDITKVAIKSTVIWMKSIVGARVKL